jgi:hypothetical protein
MEGKKINSSFFSVQNNTFANLNEGFFSKQATMTMSL